MQISSRTDKDGPYARNGGDLVDILQAFGCFDHRYCKEIAFWIERPNIGVLFVLSRGDTPREDCIPGGKATQAGWLLIRRRFLLWITHVANESHHLFFVIDTIEDDAHEAHIEGLFDD